MIFGWGPTLLSFSHDQKFCHYLDRTFRFYVVDGNYLGKF